MRFHIPWPFSLSQAAFFGLPPPFPALCPQKKRGGGCLHCHLAQEAGQGLLCRSGLPVIQTMAPSGGSLEPQDCHKRFCRRWVGCKPVTESRCCLYFKWEKTVRVRNSEKVADCFENLLFKNLRIPFIFSPIFEMLLNLIRRLKNCHFSFLVSSLERFGLSPSSPHKSCLSLSRHKYFYQA